MPKYCNCDVCKKYPQLARHAPSDNAEAIDGPALVAQQGDVLVHFSPFKGKIQKLRSRELKSFKQLGEERVAISFWYVKQGKRLNVPGPLRHDIGSGTTYTLRPPHLSRFFAYCKTTQSHGNEVAVIVDHGGWIGFGSSVRPDDRVLMMSTGDCEAPKKET